MSEKNRIEMVFYAHPWSVHLIGDRLLDKQRYNVLVEVATQSHLSYLCGGNKTKRHGVLPLLTHPARVDINSLAKSYPLIDAPLVLAANPTLTRETVVHALSAINAREHRCDTIYLLVHIASAADYSALYPLADRFHILWDTADVPTEDLVHCASALSRTESLTGDRWGGFHIGSHWLREHNAVAPNQAALEQLLSAATL